MAAFEMSDVFEEADLSTQGNEAEEGVPGETKISRSKLALLNANITVSLTCTLLHLCLFWDNSECRVGYW